MFSPVRMEKISALLLGTDARAVLRGLGGSGNLELAAPGPETVPRPPPDNSAALARCRELISRLEELRRQLGPVAGGAVGVDFAAAPFEEAAAALAAIETEAEPLLRRRKTGEEALAAAGSALERLSAYSALPLPSDLLRGSSFLRCFAGSLPAGNFKRLDAAAGKNFFLALLSAPDGREVMLGLASSDSAAALEAELARAGFIEEEPPSKPGLTLEETTAYFAAETKRAGLELSRAARAIAELAARHRGGLAGIERSVCIEMRLLEGEQYLPRSAASALLCGWAPAPDAPAVRRALTAATGGRCAVESDPAEGDAPVLLRPPALFRAFTGLVRAYGLPGYGEVDPTAFAAVLYVLMFGAMFGDAGHGMLVCAGGLWFARKGSGAARAAGRMAACCGLSGIVFGLVYGSFFGLQNFKKYALWRDPLEGDPFSLVLIALAAGAAVISLGVGLNIVNRLASGDRLGAALGRFGAAGLVFYWCALLMAAGKVGARAGLPVLGLALVCWTLKEPLQHLAAGKKGGGLEAAAEALVGTFEGILLYLANTVSFARLAAYAMSHAALLAAAYMLADAADKIWGAGSLAGLAAIIAGNAGAIALEGVVAAVQALRLEYYEFFGKFFEGGGRAFRPYVLEATGGIK